MFTINNQSDYALILISFLRGKDHFVSLTELIKHTRLPKRFLARIAAQLVSKGYLKSREGRVGGYMLAIDLHKATLYDFLNIFEKDVSITKCDNEMFECKFKDICLHKGHLKTRLKSVFVKHLQSITLNDLYT